MRYLVWKLGHKFFLTSDEMFRGMSSCRDLQLLLQTTDWQHPDVLAGELPSENIAMMTLARAVEERDPNQFKPGISNVRWRNWVHR